MITITLPPDLEQVITEQAQQHGTTPELYVLEELRQHFMQESLPVTNPQEGETMADFFAGYAGTVDSREFVPEGGHLSQDTGRKFKELMQKKYREGKL